MIKKYTVKGFKGLKENDGIELKPITIFIGPNSAGKSSLLQSLLLIKQSNNYRIGKEVLTINGEYIKLGSYKNMITDYKVSTPLQFEFSLKNLNNTVMTRFVNTTTANKVSSITFNEINVNLELKKFPKKVRLSKYNLSVIYNSSEKLKVEIDYYKGKYNIKINGVLNNDISAEVDDIFYPIIIHNEKAARSQESMKRRIFIQEILRISNRIIINKFLQINHISALRDKPSRFYFDDSSNISLVGQSGQFAATSLYNLTKSTASKSYISHIGKWMRKFELSEKIDIKEIEGEGIFKINLHNKNDLKLNLTDVGLGTSQILPIIIQSILSRKGDINIFEQPEVHLQPKIQAALMDMFIEETRNDKSFIIETHSEHLINRLQSRIADKSIDENEIGIYYISNIKGYTNILKLNINSFGEINNWPDTFFEDELNDAMYRLEQVLQRKKEGNYEK